MAVITVEFANKTEVFKTDIDTLDLFKMWLDNTDDVKNYNIEEVA